MTKVIERTSSMVDAPPQDKLHKHLHIFNACEHSGIIMVMEGSKMTKTEYGSGLEKYKQVGNGLSMNDAHDNVYTYFAWHL